MIKGCRTLLAGCCIAVAPLALAAGPTGAAGTAAGGSAAPESHNYPTQVRVEYVLSCMDDNGHDFVNVYKCSCVVDKLSAALPYGDFIEQSTFSKYATMGGEGGAEFRMDVARAQTKKYLALQTAAYHACGLSKQTTAASK